MHWRCIDFIDYFRIFRAGTESTVVEGFKKLKYRAEIDGLRAIAVGAVIFFHAGFAGFNGGFVGVDVFFVISGYLITRIILNDMESDNFCLVSFYERRARRILPALFLVTAVCIPFALIWMLPHQLRDFSRSLVAVSLFLSNVLFWREDGYFAAVSEEKPLLHTWSLAIEEQFYLVFPLCLMFLWKFGKSKIIAFLMTAIFVSLFISEWGWRYSATANFYLSPSRIWELLCGSMVAFYIKENECRAHNAGSIVGLAAILMAVFLFDDSTPHPSVYTLIPVLGTVLILIYGNTGSLVSKLLCFPPLVGLGLISYSAYLWHQPMFAFARLSSLDRPSDEMMLVLVIMCVGIAYASWKYVEQPFRNRSVVSRDKIFFLSTVAFVTLISAGILGTVNNGLSNILFSDEELSRFDQDVLRSYQKDILGDEKVDPSWVVLGDSHANALQSALDEIFIDRSISAIVETIDGCPPAQNLLRLDKNFGNRCDEKFTSALDNIDTLGVTHALISARYALYVNSDRFDNEDGGVEFGSTPRVIFDQAQYKNILRNDMARHGAITAELIKFVGALSSRGIAVYIVESIPEVGWNVPKALFLGGKHTQNVTTSHDVYKKRVLPLQSFYEKLLTMDGVTILKASEIFCDGSTCAASENGVPFYYDSNHLSIFGAEILMKSFSKEMFVQ